MGGWYNQAGFKRLFILGAGFSAPAKMPLTYQLLPLVFNKASQIHTPDCDTDSGHAQILLDSLALYCPEFDFIPEQIMKGIVPDGFNFEQFLTYMAVNSAVVSNTGEQLDEHGSQELSYFKGWTAEVIQERQVAALRRGLPPQYRLFAESLKESIVFTFNWDTLLETILDTAKIPYILDRHSYCEPPTIPILKLHGSIDWFSKDHYFRQPWMRFEPIGKSLPNYSRACEPIERLGCYYDACLTPWIVLPTFDKIYQVMHYDELWQMLYLYLQNDLEVYFIGFSFRPDDYHTRAIMYPQIMYGARKGTIKVKVIDYATDCEQEQQIRKRFEPIPNCQFWFDGFNEESMDFIFS